MNKKIVVLTGSPRDKGNSFAMTDSFVNAVKAKGHTVERFDTAKMNIGICHACDTCYKNGKACNYGDDFNKIAPSILEADVIVFTTPLYWYTFPAQLKSAIDKLYSFITGGKNISGKECALISCCEDDDTSAFDGLRIPYEKTAALLKWKSIGEVLVPGVLNPGDIEKTDGKAQASYLAEII